MYRLKLLVLFVSAGPVICVLAGYTPGYPAFLIKARKFGAKDCTFCHIDPNGGSPWASRGKWLIEEKVRRNADIVDVEWLADYKPSNESSKPLAEPQDGERTTDQKSTSTEAADADRLSQLSRYWMEAVKRYDRAALEDILSDDFMATDEQGVVVSRDEYINLDAELKVDTYSFSDVVVRFHGDAAVVSQRLSFRGSFKGEDISGDYRETTTWSRVGGRWRAVALHVSKMSR